MPEQERLSTIPPPLVAAAGWVIPGAGYWIIGQRARGVIVCVTVLLLYTTGLLIAGVRVVEVPGYDSQSGMQIRMMGGRLVRQTDLAYSRADWALTSASGLLSEIASKPWFAGQILAGPICLCSAAISVELAQNNPSEYRRPHAQLETVGTLYTAIAGMLNLMVILDAAHRAGQPASLSSAQV